MDLIEFFLSDGTTWFIHRYNLDRIAAAAYALYGTRCDLIVSMLPVVDWTQPASDEAVGLAALYAAGPRGGDR